MPENLLTFLEGIVGRLREEKKKFQELQSWVQTRRPRCPTPSNPTSVLVFISKMRDKGHYIRFKKETGGMLQHEESGEGYFSIEASEEDERKDEFRATVTKKVCTFLEDTMTAEEGVNLTLQFVVPSEFALDDYDQWYFTNYETFSHISTVVVSFQELFQWNNPLEPRKGLLTNRHISANRRLWNGIKSTIGDSWNDPGATGFTLGAFGFQCDADMNTPATNKNAVHNRHAVVYGSAPNRGIAHVSEAGTPIVLVCRLRCDQGEHTSCPGSSNTSALLTMVKTTHPHYLPSAVKSWRDEAIHDAGNPNSLGKHLSLIINDPDRIDQTRDAPFRLDTGDGVP
ncbi:hypothetical protein BJF83_20505 [Nocardiopsis sp. CNR-923]|nr:hypothetical protein BJF83_20505 [Nocardiopsis sp. CNR-923]